MATETIPKGEATKRVEQVIRNLQRRKYQKLAQADYSNEGIEIFDEPQFARDLGITPEDLEGVMSVKRATPIFGSVGMMFAPSQKEMKAIIPQLTQYLESETKATAKVPKAPAKPEVSKLTDQLDKISGIEKTYWRPDTSTLTVYYDEAIPKDAANVRIQAYLAENALRDSVERLTFISTAKGTFATPKAKAVPKPKEEEAKPSVTGIQDKRSDRAIAIDRALLAKRVVTVDNADVWRKNPNRVDIRGVDTPVRGRIVAGVAYADKGKKRLSRKHHRGWKKVKFG